MQLPHTQPPRSSSQMDALFASALPIGNVGSPQKTVGGRVSTWLEAGGANFLQKNIPEDGAWRVAPNGTHGEVRLCAQVSAAPWSFLLVLESDSELNVASRNEESNGRRAIRRNTPLKPFEGVPLLRVGDGVHTAFASFRSDEARALVAGDVLQVRATGVL